MADTTPTPTDLPEALIDDLELAVLGATKTGNTAVVHQARKALLAALTASAQAEAVDKESLTVAQPQAGAESYPAEPTPDELRAIAREARNSSGSASDDCGPAAYVLHGWRAATAALRARGAVPSGWKLVPVEPNDDMLEVFNASDAYFIRYNKENQPSERYEVVDRDSDFLVVGKFADDDEADALAARLSYAKHYRAMLAAAPQPPAALPGEQDAAVLAHLDALKDDAAAHIFPSDLQRCMTRECCVEVSSVRMGRPGERSVPLFSRKPWQPPGTAAPRFLHPRGSATGNCVASWPQHLDAGIG